MEAEQKEKEILQSYWDSTGEWRLTYFDKLKGTPDSQLNDVLRAEKETAVVEEKTFRDLLENGVSSVLELGCGVGRSMIKEISLYPEKEFWGVDISSHQIELFQKQINILNAKNAYAIACDAGNMQCIKRKFDLIMMCNNSFGNFLGKTREGALSEMCRLLSKHGKVLISGFSNLDMAQKAYDEWGVKVEDIDYNTGLCRLENYNSFWQSMNDTNQEFLNRGFSILKSIPTTMGFVNVYQYMEKEP